MIKSFSAANAKLRIHATMSTCRLRFWSCVSLFSILSVKAFSSVIKIELQIFSERFIWSLYWKSFSMVLILDVEVKYILIYLKVVHMGWTDWMSSERICYVCVDFLIVYNNIEKVNSLMLPTENIVFPDSGIWWSRLYKSKLNWFVFIIKSSWSMCFSGFGYHLCCF